MVVSVTEHVFLGLIHSKVVTGVVTMAGKRPSKLTHSFVQSVAKEGRYGDGRGGHGLSLLVKRTANGRWSKTWSQRLRIGEEKAQLGLGSFPDIILADAREKALHNSQRVAQGEDIRKPLPVIPTVNEAFDIVIAQRRSSWKGKMTERTWLLSKQYCKAIGPKPVSEIKPQDVADVLAPIWQEKAKTAREVRSNLSTVMAWAINREYRTTNPATPSTVQELGKQPRSKRHRSLKPDQLGSALAKVRDADAWWGAKYCLIFLALTGVRSAETREATWEEMDLDAAIWTIPVDRTKNDIEHIVPLSTQAVEILRYARKRTGRTKGIVFPPERGGHHMDSKRLSNLMIELDIPAVPHGDRASVRNWAGGRADIAQPAAEMVLGHKQGSKIERTYLTADFFEHRCPIMQDWADYLAETMGPVISPSQKTSREVQQEKRASSRVQTFGTDPIGENEYELIVQHFEQSRYSGFPDQATLTEATGVAAIALMRDGLLRPRGTAKVRWSDLQQEDDGSGLLTVPSLRKHKPGPEHVAYLSLRTMQALEAMRRIRQQLGSGAKDGRILQLTENALPKHIKKACAAAGLTGKFGGYSPRNGMEQDLIRSGVGVNERKEAKGWRLMGTTQSERESLARNGAVAQWYAQKREEKKVCPQQVPDTITAELTRTNKAETPSIAPRRTSRAPHLVR